MAILRPDAPPLPELPRPPAAMTFESFAERLRAGPLRTLLTLNVRAGVLAADVDADDGQRLAKLVELAQLTQLAMAQFRDVSAELQSLIDGLTAAIDKAP